MRYHIVTLSECELSSSFVICSMTVLLCVITGIFTYIKYRRCEDKNLRRRLLSLYSGLWFAIMMFLIAQFLMLYWIASFLYPSVLQFYRIRPPWTAMSLLILASFTAIAYSIVRFRADQ